MLRLRGGFGTDGGETTRLKGLGSAYMDAGADGIVMGFLNGLSQVDLEVCAELAGNAGWPWTFHRAIDSALDPAKAWRDVQTLPGLDRVLTSGSARGLRYGLDDLMSRAHSDPSIARLIVAGGGLAPEHVPWLAQAGIRGFHIGAPARPQRSYTSYVDPRARQLLAAPHRLRGTPPPRHVMCDDRLSSVTTTLFQPSSVGGRLARAGRRSPRRHPRRPAHGFAARCGR